MATATQQPHPDAYLHPPPALTVSGVSPVFTGGCAMKDQWVADSADFCKYGLLRALCDPDPTDEYRPLRLGVVWYLTPDSGKKDPEAHGYLHLNAQDARLYTECDSILYEQLRTVRRSVSGIECGGVLPGSTVYFADCVPKRQGKDGAQKRKKWAQAAQDQTADCCLVFVDPDTGLEPKGSTGPKHARYDELRPYVERGQSLVIYQHLSRKGTVVQQTQDKKAEVERELGPAFTMINGRRRGGWVMYLVVTAKRHRGRLEARAEAMLSTDWARHFLMVK